MSSVINYMLLFLLVNIIFGSGFFPCKAEVLSLTQCELKNGTLVCQDGPVAEASIRRPISLEPLEIAFIIAVIAAILFILVCCICPATEFCAGNVGTCWGDLDRKKFMRDRLYPPITPVENDLKINSVLGADTNVENSRQIQSSDTLVSNPDAGLEPNRELENPKVSKKKRLSPVDCVIEVCACV